MVNFEQKINTQFYPSISRSFFLRAQFESSSVIGPFSIKMLKKMERETA